MEQWPVSILLVAALNCVGWAIKRSGALSTKLIPIVLMVLGAMVYPFVASSLPTVRNPMAILVMYGLLLGVAAWIVHGIVWKRLAKLCPDIGEVDEPNNEKDKK